MLKLTEELLKIEYYQNQLPLYKIAQKYKTSRNTVERLSKKYKLKLRSKSKNYLNKKIGWFLIKEKIPKNLSKDRRYVYWRCICKCGTERILTSSQLGSGQFKSCGCRKLSKKYEGMCGEFWNKVLYRSKTKGIPLTISKEEVWELYLKQDGKCYYTGLTISFCDSMSKTAKGIGPPQTASLDRLDNTKGYISGNVAWVHKNVNAFKNSLSHDDFIKICHLVSRKFKEPETINITDKYMPHIKH